MLGRTIGKYRFVERLGRGATGVVYKAIDTTLGREVAIKVLNPDVADADAMRRFRAEATILAKLNHPEIATIYEFVRAETDLLIVMEFVRGETLEHLTTRHGPMAPNLAACLVSRILTALEYAHRAGIVHRDMKPANVMVTALGIKIMDFGIARMRGTDQSTSSGALMGTPAYMAPEQVVGQHVDGRADVYAVGAILYRLLTSALPFDADSTAAMLYKQVSAAPKRLTDHRHDLPDWCEPVVLRALAKSPAERFQTAEEFRSALTESLGIASIRDFPEDLALDVNPASAEVEPSMIASPPNVSTVPITKRLRIPTRKEFLAAGVSALALLVAGLALFGQMTRENSTAATDTAFPPLVFDATVLVGQRERTAQVVMADGQLTVATLDAPHDPLYVVPFHRVSSISYSRGADPVWSSPKGRARAARTKGALGLFRLERNWVTLSTDIDDRLVVLWFRKELVLPVLSALEERTGRTREIL